MVTNSSLDGFGSIKFDVPALSSKNQAWDNSNNDASIIEFSYIDMWGGTYNLSPTGYAAIQTSLSSDGFKLDSSGYTYLYPTSTALPYSLTFDFNDLDFVDVRVPQWIPRGEWNWTETTGLVPIPPTLWLFGSGLLGLIGMTRWKTA